MREQENKKDTVTYTEIGQKLKKDSLRNIPSLCIAYPMLFGMTSIFYLANMVLFDIFATVSIILLFGCFVSTIIEMVITISDVNHKRYSVTDDNYVKQTEERKPLNSRSRRFIFHFESGRKYIISPQELISSDKLPYQTLIDYMRFAYSASFSHEGDPFYVVTFDRKPETIVLMFNKTIFDYKDQ